MASQVDVSSLCWSHGFSAEQCCTPDPADGCFDLGLSRDICCQLPRNRSRLARDVVFMLGVLRVARRHTECALQDLEQDCELKLMDRLAGLGLHGLDPEGRSGQGALKRWAERSWLEHRRIHPIDRGKALFWAQQAAEVALGWRMVGYSHLQLIYDETVFERLHLAATGQQRLFMQRTANQSWARHMDLFAKSQFGGGASGRMTEVGHASQSERIAVVHIAMVASAGRPVYATKAMAGIRSALFFASERLVHFHLFVDDEGQLAMEDALGMLDPWLRAKGHFTMYGEAVMRRFLKTLHSRMPAGCLSLNKHYGDSGWIRLFVHEVIPQDSGVEWLIFVDAGDYVFLEDPALMLRHAANFRSEQAAGGPASWSAIPVQLFNLNRMRKMGWSDQVFDATRQRIVTEGAEACGIGEGWVTKQLSQTSLWHVFETETVWCFEPYEYFQPSMGWKDVWSGDVFKNRIYPGVKDWTSVRVYCPAFADFFFSTIAHYDVPSRPHLAEALVRHAQSKTESVSNSNVSLMEYGMYLDDRAEHIICNQKVLGIHFLSGMKMVPWVWEFLNYWVGEEVWGVAQQKEIFMSRTLLRARGSWYD